MLLFRLFGLKEKCSIKRIKAAAQLSCWCRDLDVGFDFEKHLKLKGQQQVSTFPSYFNLESYF